MMYPKGNDGNKQKAHDIACSRKFYGKNVDTRLTYMGEKLKDFVLGFFIW